MDDLLKEALEKFSQSSDAADFNRQNYEEDIRFSRLSDQWPDDIAAQRKAEGRPALTINKMPPLIRSVVNEARQSKPAIKVSPVDNGADEDTAEVIAGLIKSVERNSNADVAYDTAIDCAVSGGFGFFRVSIDYAHDETFELEARIERIANPLSVHWDTNSTRFDAADWDYCFISEWLSKDEFEEKYPDASLDPFQGDSGDESSAQWLDDDSIRVAEWFQRIPVTKKLLQLTFTDPNTGNIERKAVRQDDIPAMAKRFFEAGGMDVEDVKENDLQEQFFAAAGITVTNERDVETFEVKRRVINGSEVLEEDDWPGSSIPVCPVWGDEVYIDGRRHLRSLIRDAKDSQMMFNFWRSGSTELVALAPKAPFIGPKGFIPKGQEAKWNAANNRSFAYLEYEGNIPPQRQPFPGVPAGAIQEAVNASHDIQDITGIYPAAIGAKSNETSGKAIMARERQGDVANFHFIDNLNRAIQYCGRVLVEIIPAVYSAKEAIRILGDDDKEKVVKLTMEDGGSLQTNMQGEQRLYNLMVGKYDVTVSSGPSFATQREETRETLIEIMRAVPQAAQFVGDVLLDHMDFVGADKVAKRLKSLLPPELRNAEESEDFANDPEKAALVQQNQALQQQMQQAQQAVMQEIEKIKQENEALKQSKQIEMQRLQLESQYKGQELALKDRELSLKEAEAVANQDQPKPSYQEQWEYDRAMEMDRLTFQAAENEKNRQLERDKMTMQLAQNVMQKEGCTEQEAQEKAERIMFLRDDCGNIVEAVKAYHSENEVM